MCPEFATPSERVGSCPGSGVAEGTDDDDFRQRPDWSDGHCGQSDDGIIAQGGDGFQGHVTGVLRANQLSLNSRGRIRVLLTTSLRSPVRKGCEALRPPYAFKRSPAGS